MLALWEKKGNNTIIDRNRDPRNPCQSNLLGPIVILL